MRDCVVARVPSLPINDRRAVPMGNFLHEPYYPVGRLTGYSVMHEIEQMFHGT
jgi:hypothetical protein